MRKLLWRRKQDNNIDLLAYLPYISFPDTQRANTLSSLIDSHRPFPTEVAEDVGGGASSLLWWWVKQSQPTLFLLCCVFCFLVCVFVRMNTGGSLCKALLMMNKVNTHECTHTDTRAHKHTLSVPMHLSSTTNSVHRHNQTHIQARCHVMTSLTLKV